MQYYHFRSIRNVSLQILRTVTIQTKGDRRPYYEVFIPDRFIIRYESKFLACCFAFFKSEHVYVERETSATVSRVPRQLRFR